MTNLSSSQLIQLSKKEKHAQKRIRLLAVAKFLECNNRAEVARQLNVSRRSVNNWVTNYLRAGASALDDKPRPGKESRLSLMQKQGVIRYVNQAAFSQKGGRLIADDVRDFIETEYGITYSTSHIYWILHQLGFSWITSRSKHPKQSLDAQEEFKKTKI